jgi:hypothetical protein
VSTLKSEFLFLRLTRLLEHFLRYGLANMEAKPGVLLTPCSNPGFYLGTGRSDAWWTTGGYGELQRIARFDHSI